MCEFYGREVKRSLLYELDKDGQDAEVCPMLKDRVTQQLCQSSGQSQYSERDGGLRFVFP